MSRTRTVFITGGSGYLGRRLIPRLAEAGYEIRALTRSASAHKIPAGCQAVLGDALRKVSSGLPRFLQFRFEPIQKRRLGLLDLPPGDLERKKLRPVHFGKVLKSS